MEAIIIYALFVIFFPIWGYVMRKVILTLIKFGIYLGRVLNTWWSNIYWRKKARREVWLDDSDKRAEDEKPNEYIQRIADKVMKTFDYAADDAEQLWDSVPPPTEMYARWRDCADGFCKTWGDDCDGFASLLYHFAAMSGIECRLMSVNSAVNGYGHAVLAIRHKGLMYVQDYTKQLAGLKETSEHYTAQTGGEFVVTYKEYDYIKHKWRVSRWVAAEKALKNIAMRKK